MEWYETLRGLFNLAIFLGLASIPVLFILGVSRMVGKSATKTITSFRK